MLESSDEVIIKKVLKGNEDAFGELITKYQHLVFIIVIKILKSEDDSKDILQEVFLKAFQNLKGFKGNSKFSTWLSTIAFREAYNFKKKRYNTSFIGFDQKEHEDFSEELQPDSLLEIKEKKKMIDCAVSKLDTQDSIIVTLYYMEEMSLKEISDILDISVNNLKARLFKSRKTLRKIFRNLKKDPVRYGS